PADAAPLFRDLWVDALREYAWSVAPERWAAESREGIGAYASLAPRYASMRDAGDVEPLFGEHAERLRRAGPDLWYPCILNWHVGNEVELSTWGANLPAVFPEAIWLPLERALWGVRAAAPPAPASYVRAGSLRDLPPLPGEDLVGVNQYTGRYGGRIEQVAAHLDLFSRWCQAAGRPLGITEWNGPQYSWAANGIGGVHERGAAYYVQRYYEAMVDTPTLALSNEFTLNWIIWRVEDLTNRTREEEWRDRPPYSKFGGGRTADHVPAVPLDRVYRGLPYRALQAVYSPLLPLVRTPGRIVVGCAHDAQPLADELATALRALGKESETRLLTPKLNPEELDAHLILIGGAANQQPELIARLEREGWIDAALPGFPPAARPLIQRRLNPFFPTRGLVSVTGSTIAAREAGVRQLVTAAQALHQLWAAEGAMVRAVALVDAGKEAPYERLLFEFVGRGYLLGGDDTRTRLDPSEFLDEQGRRRTPWWNLHAVILDTTRALETSEVEAVRRLARTGTRIVLSLPCYQANPSLQQLLGVRVGPAHRLTEAITPAPALRAPVPLLQIGNIQQEVVERFQPGANLAPLEVRQLDGEGVEPLAWIEPDRAPVAVRVRRGAEEYALVGFAIGAVADLHRRVASSGTTHPLYDRDTASGLERPGRFAINLCLQEMPQPRVLPRLHGLARIEDPILKADGHSTLTVRLFDTEGRPQTGASVRARAQWARDARPVGAAGTPVDLVEVEPGVYRCPIALAGT
ncbi:MAG: hypothetical protein QHJ73_13690, partial [Armatimonadota bacterium]|nr:hypothetical protein [Armatimonadota bacterium]